MFDPNGPFMYGLVAVVILFVIAMSVRFIVLAWKRAKKIGMDPKVLRRVAVSSAIFTIAPAVSILLGVIALSRALGFPLPWLRLSVIGALTYETPAAASAAARDSTKASAEGFRSAQARAAARAASPLSRRAEFRRAAGGAASSAVVSSIRPIRAGLAASLDKVSRPAPCLGCAIDAILHELNEAALGRVPPRADLDGGDSP